MTSWSRATQSEDRKMPDEMAGAAGSADGEVSSQTPAPVKPQQTETPDPVFARLFEWRDEALADVRKGLERLDAGTASKAPARRGESMIPLVVGAALSVCGLLTWTMAARSFVRGIRFGLESYIGSSNAGR